MPGAGHSAEFLANPALFMLRAWRECGELAEFDLGGVRNILMVGPDAHEAVYRAPDEQLSAAEPYKYMVPVFGEGIQYGAPLAIERQQVKFLTHALRPDKMKGYARVIAQEVEAWIASWGDEGERDFYDEFKELVLRTSTHCLMGSRVPRKAHRGVRRAVPRSRAGDLAAGRARRPLARRGVREARPRARAAAGDADGDRARAAARWRRSPRHARGVHERALPRRQRARRRADPGHDRVDHVRGLPHQLEYRELDGGGARAQPAVMPPPIAREIDAVYRPGGDLSFAGLRELPALDRFIGEVLRLHPPLVTLMRQVMRDFEYKGNVFPPGTVLAISPYVSHRVPEVFPDPERFDPDAPAAAERVRLDPVRRRPAQVRRQCVRAAPGAVDLLRAARALRVRAGRPARDLPRRDAVADPAAERAVPAALSPAAARMSRCASSSTSICVRDTRVCQSEAPEIFRVVDRPGDYARVEVILERPPEELRAQAEAAARYCPNRVITIVED